jgi:hypothetical protein
MLFGETVAVYCEKNMERIDTLCGQNAEFVPHRKRITSQSKSKSHYDRRPVGQCVLVSSPVRGSWPDANYCLTVTLLSISDAPSDEKSGLSFVLVTPIKPNRLMLFGETVAVCCENHTEHINKFCEQNAEFQYVNAGGTYSYTNHWALKG